MKAEYEEMNQQALAIDNAIQNYNNSVRNLYEKISSLGTVWHGIDNKEYVNKILSFKQDIENLGIVVNNYSILLKKSVLKLQEAQEEICNIK